MLFLLFNTPEKMAEVTILKCMDLLLHSYLEEIDSKSVPLTSRLNILPKEYNIISMNKLCTNLFLVIYIKCELVPSYAYFSQVVVQPIFTASIVLYVALSGAPLSLS
jgi:hypothetical protein